MDAPHTAPRGCVCPPLGLDGSVRATLVAGCATLALLTPSVIIMGHATMGRVKSEHVSKEQPGSLRARPTAEGKRPEIRPTLFSHRRSQPQAAEAGRGESQGSGEGRGEGGRHRPDGCRRGRRGRCRGRRRGGGCRRSCGCGGGGRAARLAQGQRPGLSFFLSFAPVALCGPARELTLPLWPQSNPWQPVAPLVLCSWFHSASLT